MSEQHGTYLVSYVRKLEAALNRIKGLVDAPDPDLSGDRQAGVHCGLEDLGLQHAPYAACDYGYSEGVSRMMEWAVNEAESALKDSLDSGAPPGVDSGATKGPHESDPPLPISPPVP